MPELLLELLSEEIPARMQRRAIEDLVALLRDKLAAAEIPAAKLRGYVTPRRLAVIADGIAPKQPDRTEERRGPRVGVPRSAIDGFLRSVGMSAIGECEIRDTGRGEFYFAVINRAGRPSNEVLPDLVKSAIFELPWPKSMRWPGSTLRWARPLSSIVCLYDGAVLPLAITGLPVGRTTRGHRFLSPGEICIGSAEEYLEKLQHAYVILDQDRRRKIIEADLDHRAAELGVAVKLDRALLDEVVGLAEFPVVLAGSIDADFMTLPPEVLATAMRTHQKYFSCIDAQGRTAPHFLFVANNITDDGAGAIVAGNERVLRARLADARFFWDQDRKIRLEDRVEALKDRVFHAKLGSVYDKVKRTEGIAFFLAEQLYPAATPAQRSPLHISDLTNAYNISGNNDGELSRLAKRGAHLAKADLSSGMVGEFPELQGIMGRYFALHDDEDERVANAIAEHYKPLGAKDTCPTAIESVVVALADKIDTLVALFSIGEKPTGSGDPYALRRAALGVIRLIRDKKLRLPLRAVFTEATKNFHLPAKVLSDTTNEVLAFIIERLRVHLREEGIRHDWIAAVLQPASQGENDDDLLQLVDRGHAVKRFLSWDAGANLLIAYRRASNIVAIEERRDGLRYDQPVNAELLLQKEETLLNTRLNEVAVLPETSFASSDTFSRAMTSLASLRYPIDEFFDKVSVNDAEPALRENRLRLLSRIRDTMNQVADFSQIEG